MTKYIEWDKLEWWILNESASLDTESDRKCVISRLKKDIPAADVQPIVRCKDCEHFHLDYFEEVYGVNIIVAHEICDFWAGGCKTMQDAFCSNGVRKDGK